jgi:hypothetical protein
MYKNVLKNQLVQYQMYKGVLEAQWVKFKMYKSVLEAQSTPLYTWYFTEF